MSRPHWVDETRVYGILAREAAWRLAVLAVLREKRVGVWLQPLCVWENNPYKFIDLDGNEPSPALLRAIVPGQGSWDNSRPEWANGNYGSSVAWAGAMVAEQVAFVATLRTEQALGVGAKAAATEVAQAAKGAATGAESAVNGLQLNKLLASEPVSDGEAGTTMAGPGARVPFRDAARVAEEHGGNAADWVKKSGSSHTARDGTTFETHWVENAGTGQRVEFTKFPGGGD